MDSQSHYKDQNCAFAGMGLSLTTCTAVPPCLSLLWILGTCVCLKRNMHLRKIKDSTFRTKYILERIALQGEKTFILYTLLILSQTHVYWWMVHTVARASADSPRWFPGSVWTGTVWPSWPSGRPRKAFWHSGRSCVAPASCARLSGWRQALLHWHYPGLGTWLHIQPYAQRYAHEHREERRWRKDAQKQMERIKKDLLTYCFKV